MNRLAIFLKTMFLPGHHTAAANRPPPKIYRRYWLTDLVALAALTALTIIAFEATGLDPWITGRYYMPDSPWKPFQLHLHAPWTLLYEYIAVPVILLAVAALTVYLAGHWKTGWRKYRKHCAFILLVLILGPGIVVNFILKEQWGRPRPKKTEMFGGEQAYCSALNPGPRDAGKSFPCGHASVGYLFVVFYFIYRRKRKTAAFLWLAFALLFGTLIGYGRVIGGAHYASDVVWSGLIIFFLAWLLYYFIMNIPGREDAEAAAPAPLDSTADWAVFARTALIVILIVLASLTATPHAGDILYGSESLRKTSSGLTIELNIAHANADILFESADALLIQGDYEGFGWARNEIINEYEQDLDSETPRIVYTLDRKGFFMEYDAEVRIRIPAGFPGQLKLNVRDGEVRLLGRPPNAAIDIRQTNSTIQMPEEWREIVRKKDDASD